MMMNDRIKMIQRAVFLGLPLLLMLYLIHALGYILPQLLPVEASRHGWLIVASAGLLGGMILCTRYFNIYITAAIAFALYAAWGFYAGTEPFSDFGTYYIRAKMFMAEPSIEVFVHSKSPITVIFYGVIFAIMGAGYSSIYIINALAYAGQILLIYHGLVNFGVPKLNARFSAVLYGFLASTVFFVPVISSESVFNLLAALGIYLLSLNPSRFSALFLLSSSFIFGLLFLTRSTGLFYFFGSLIYLCFYVRPFHCRHIGWFLIPFCACLAFQGTVNWVYRGTVSLSASPWHHLNFLIGTNKEHGGLFNADDIAVAGYDAAALNRGEVIDRHDGMKHYRRASVDLAWTRIREDIPGFAVFALTDKVNNLWSNDNYALYYAVRNSRIQTRGNRFVTWGYGWLNVNLAMMLMLTVISLGGYLWNFRNFPARISGFVACMVCLPSILMMAVFFWVEVSPRYHQPFMMLFAMGNCMLPAFVRKFQDRSRQRPVEEAQHG